MDELRDLYQNVILDHNKSPRNFGRLDDANRTARGHNPLCGDQLTLYLEVDDDDRIADVRFEGQGCAISTASASLMTEFVKGRPLAEVLDTFERFHALVTRPATEEVEEEGLGKLAVFAGVREYPARVKCATLSWHTLQSALQGEDEVVVTE